MAKQLVTRKQLDAFSAIEKAAVRARGIGYKVEFQAFMNQLKSGGVAGKSDDVRVTQAKRLWDRGVGKTLGFADFESYLATIPEIPEVLLSEDTEFPYLVLVDGRVSLTKLCELANVKMLVAENDLVSHDDRHADFTAPTWIRIQDGRKNHGKTVRVCRTEFKSRELGLTAFQGVSAVIQHSMLVADWNGTQGPVHVMDLPGSVSRGHYGRAACLVRSDGRLRLCWDYADSAHGLYGSSSRRE